MQLSRDVASVTFRFLYHEHKFIILCSRNNVQELRKWVALRAPIFKNKTILKLCFQDACKDGRVHIVRLLFRFFCLWMTCAQTTILLFDMHVFMDIL